MTKLFVGGLPYAITNQQLNDLFAEHGAVTSASIVTDKFSGQSKGFGFVEMTNDDEAQKAIEALNGYALEGRSIGVSVARPREDRPQGGGFNRDNRGGGGGFGGRSNDRGGNRGGFGGNRGGGGSRGGGSRY